MVGEPHDTATVGARFGLNAYNVTSYKPHARPIAAHRRADGGFGSARRPGKAWAPVLPIRPPAPSCAPQGMLRQSWGVQAEMRHLTCRRSPVLTQRLFLTFLNQVASAASSQTHRLDALVRHGCLPGRHCQKHAAYRESDEVDLRWGGHKCARTMVAVVLHRSGLIASPSAKCLYALDQAGGARSFTDATMATSRRSARTGEERPPSARRSAARRTGVLFAPFV